ncbi:class D sortase [Fredinandcohnia sp. 179-A 10B2 NHS]|uniref:class D sortase n=1 Tax=Fredinandcohnia sp. 179-A 10B2 NHS TaxID=3235176 RepID=UPI0039A24501
MKKVIYSVAILLITGGVLLSGYSLFQIWETDKSQKEALAKAEELITEAPEETEVSIPTFGEGDAVGILEVPKLEEKLPIVEGTDDDQLAKGVGHYLGTALPTQNDQIVLSGHRDTVFKRFDELELGDEFIVKLQYGEFKYKIVDTKIVEADDRTVIKSTAPREELVVTTCYPFGYIGNAPQRYIFYAEKVE